VRKSRRQKVIRTIEGVGVALILLNLTLYFAMLRPVQNGVASEERRFAETRRRIRIEGERVERLEKFRANLPGAGDNIQAFKREQIPPRQHGFSQVGRLLRNASEEAGVQAVGTKKFKLDTEHNQPLERLGFEANVQGSFAELMKFAHGVETASDFVVIREFSFEAGQGGGLNLRLAADLYLTP